MRFAYTFLLLNILTVTQVLASATTWPNAFCKPWGCINDKVGVSTLENGTLTFDRSRLDSYLMLHLSLEWKGSIVNALNTCLGDKKPRRYANTCPGQDTWHCIIDQLIENCPENIVKKEDSCTPVSSLVASKYLFYQNKYVNFDSTIQSDQRPPFFLRNNFRSKCCDLPALFNSSVLLECGVTEFMNVHVQQTISRTRTATVLPPSTEEYCSQPMEDTLQVNPLECCDTTDFVPSSVFSECGLDMRWQKDERLVIKEKENAASTTEVVTTEKVPAKIHRNPDIQVLPEKCSGVTCVFRKLNIISADGSIDRDAFSRLLDEMAQEHPAWSSARARVVTRCVKRDLSTEYGDCEINRLVACTLDVLSENCPNVKKGWFDPCRHSSTSHNTTAICQVSSSKFRRNRHRYCDIPRLVPRSALAGCGLTSISRMMTVKNDLPASPKKHIFKYKPSCIDISNATACVLDKMGVLNKYKFMDYHKMKELVDGVVRDRYSWSRRKSLVQDALRFTPLYREYCFSTRKLLNVMDAAITNCPYEKRKYTGKCGRLYVYLQRCATKTVSPNTPKPAGIQLNITQHKPFLWNVATNRNGTLQTKMYPVTHTVTKYPKYAPKFTYYIPAARYASVRTAFPGSKYPPTENNSNLGVLGLQRASMAQPSISVYGPIFSHGYVQSQQQINRGQASVPVYNARPLLYRPYYRDNFRSVSKPLFINNPIASSQKQGSEERASTTTQPIQLQHLLPIEGQVHQ